jgi:hypothetical protein
MLFASCRSKLEPFELTGQLPGGGNAVVFVEAYAFCVRWGQPAAGPQGEIGPQGPRGPVAADQSCQADAYVSGIAGGKIVCTPISP